MISLRGVEKAFPTVRRRLTCCAGSISTSSRVSSFRSWARREPGSRRCFTSWECTISRGPVSIYFDDIPVHKLDGKEARGVAQSEHRVCFSELSPARRSNRFRKPRAAALLSRRQQERPAIDRLRHARSFSDGGQERSVSNATFRRTTTARRDCASRGCQPANNPGGRADRKSSFSPGQRDHGHVQTPER